MTQKDLQSTLADQLFHPEKQDTKTAVFLAKMESVIDWNPLVKIVSSLNKNGTKKGDRPTLEYRFEANIKDNRSRVMREYYARFCENLGLKYPGLLDKSRVCMNEMMRYTY